MNSEQVPNALYLVLLLVLVGSAVATRQLPIKQTAKLALAWIAIFAVVLSIVTFRDEWIELGRRVTGAVAGTETEAVVGAAGELRVPMREDGHFWVKGTVNRVETTFLIDSGASLTTIGKDVAEQAELRLDLRVAPVETANGRVVMRRTKASLIVGPIVRQDMAMLVAEQPGLNVLGMNFLSSLRGWRAEGRTLILQP